MKKLTEEQIEEIRTRHNNLLIIRVGNGDLIYRGDGTDGVFGWNVVPQEWIDEVREEGTHS